MTTNSFPSSFSFSIFFFGSLTVLTALLAGCAPETSLPLNLTFETRFQTMIEQFSTMRR